MPQSRANAIASAEKAFAKLEEHYQPYLLEQLEKINVAAKTSDWTKVIFLSHNISGEAGSMGWPHASMAAALLRQTIEEETVKQRQDAVRLCLNSLMVIVKQNLRGNSDAGAQLIEELTHMVAVLSETDS